MFGKLRVIFAFGAIAMVYGCTRAPQYTITDQERVHAFYYSWYGNPEFDGEYRHWKHDILPHWSNTSWNNAGTFPGGEDIGANFYPQLGTYSSTDTSIVHQHMKWAKQAGIGVLAMSWWGKNSFEDKSLKMYLDIADTYGLALAIHLEPFYTSAEELKKQLDYLADTYSSHPALYRYRGRIFYYMYDSYKLPQSEWSKLLTQQGEFSVRNAETDGFFMGLWVNEKDGEFLDSCSFDGFYTYFASNGFTYGSSTVNWPTMQAFAAEHHMLFIPCVGPGYLDTRIRPWNNQNARAREGGAYYNRMTGAAIALASEFIGITSFNEWHEGTQIEPAIPKKIEGYQYEDYGDSTEAVDYLELTAQWVKDYKQRLKPRIREKR